MSDTSSIRSLPARRQLFRVAFEGEDTAHWALFPSDRPGLPDGVLCHVGVEKNKSGKKVAHELRYHPIKINTSSAGSAFPIHGAVIAEWQLRQAAQTVFERKAYRVVTNNCQHFCIDVLVELNRNWPDMVPAQAIVDVQARGTKFTKMTTFFTRFRFQREQRMLEAQRAQFELRNVQARPRISID
ncbi:hypothetical protein CBER1_02140 [Cercospora berteroae]|uniref:PPPDE domain-containing protein n=1 Tax=Cercospora berteroae TaxID=357750 RepID=A0A2S6BQG2_9PEZI|nr:hypothetical protein CBER1_02140 [Cercospora berteroae]